MSSMEALMEKIRSRVDLSKTLLDTAKSVRIGLADKRHSLDIQDKEIYRSCLDKLQASIKVRTTQGLMEKLETIARQMNLESLQNNQPSLNQNQLFITSELFYMDIMIDNNGTVQTVVIHHQIPPKGSVSYTQNCPEIVECLTNHDFKLFVKHLEGLNSVYKLNCGGLMEKSRAWQVLCNLEEDLMRLYKAEQSRSFPKDLNQIIHQTNHGLAEPRAGGLPMKLRIFLSPFQLIDQEEKKMLSLTEKTVISKDLGFSLSVGIESSEVEHVLPLSQAISNQGEELDLGGQNCGSLTACFTLTTSSPLPVSHKIIQHIVSRTGVSFGDDLEESSLFSLISRQESKGSLDSRNNRGLFVTLPDQQHCYFLTDTDQLNAKLITTIPFRHPSQVAGIVDALRRQAFFNSLVASCVRTNSLEDVDTSTMFEITCLDPFCQSLTVGFEHEEDLATVELILNHITEPKCNVYINGESVKNSGSGSTAGNGEAMEVDKAGLEAGAKRVLVKSLSIPITMRYILKNSKDPTLSKQIKTESDCGGTSSSGGGENNNSDIKPGHDQSNFKSEQRSSHGTDSGGKIKKEKNENESKDSLNRLGPQSGDKAAGAHISISRSSAGSSSGGSSSSSSSQGKMRPPTIPDSGKKPKSDGSLTIRKTDKDDLSGISISRISGHEVKSKHSSSSQQQSSSSKHSSSSKEDGIQPNVSITPISGRDSQDHKIQNKSDNAGIEIIPLGGLSGDGSSQHKSKPRDYKRSLSEDDKRRMEKKEKRRRDESKSGSGSGSSGSGGGSSGSGGGSCSGSSGDHRQSHKEKSSSSSHKSSSGSGEGKSKDPKAKLAGVIERLAHHTGDSVNIEIRPAQTKSDKEKSSGMKSGHKSSKDDSTTGTITIDPPNAGYKVSNSNSKPLDRLYLEKLASSLKKPEGSGGPGGDKDSNSGKSFSVTSEGGGGGMLDSGSKKHKEIILKVGGETDLMGKGADRDTTISTKWMEVFNLQNMQLVSV